MNALLDLLLCECRQDPFAPDFGQPEIVDIPSSEITDLSDTI